MDRQWLIDQWLQCFWLVMFWGAGVWAWSESGYVFANLMIPACWTWLWALFQEIRMQARETRWRADQIDRDWEQVNAKIEFFMRNNVTIELRPIEEDDDDDDDEEPKSKLQ